MSKIGLKLLQSWMTKKPIHGPQEKQKRDQESLIQEKRLMSLKPGSENSDGLRGIYLDGCVIDEYANIQGKLFTEIIRPALSDRKGWCVFIGTPQGTNNNFYELFKHNYL